MNIKRFNVSKAGRKYQDAQGQEKTVWNNIGTITEFHKPDGAVSRLLEIPAIGLEANIFPFVAKEKGDSAPQRSLNDEYNDDGGYEINPDDVPF